MFNRMSDCHKDSLLAEGLVFRQGGPKVWTPAQGLCFSLGSFDIYVTFVYFLLGIRHYSMCWIQQ